MEASIKEEEARIEKQKSIQQEEEKITEQI